MSEITTQLKELYSLKNQYEKLQNGTFHFFEKSEIGWFFEEVIYPILYIGGLCHILVSTGYG